MGGVAGGVVSEIYGGNFWQGFAQGAGTAAAAFLFNCAMSRYKLINQSANRQVWIDTQTGKQVPAPGKYVDPLTEYANNFINDAVIPALPYAAGAAVTLATDNPKLGLMVYGWTGTLMGLLFDRPAGIPLPGIRRINPIINPPEAW